MNIFRKRPLASILCIMLGSFSLFSDINDTLRYVLIALSVICLSLILIFSKTKKNKIFLSSLLIAFVLAGALSSIYFSIFFPKYESGSEVEITGTVTEISSQESSTFLTLSSYSLGEEGAMGKALVRYYYAEGDYRHRVGDTVTFKGRIYIPGKDGLEEDAYNIGKGYSLLLTNSSTVLLISSDNAPISLFFLNIRTSVRNKLIKYSDRESGELLSALILGERTGLNEYTEFTFKRIGITHILALSGMHLAILAAAVFGIFRLLKLNKRLSYIFVMLLTFFYMFLTGMPASVVRAGLMVIISSFLFLLASTSDSLTNLLISFFVIILIEPYAIYDLSLILSVFATFGIIAFTILRKDKGKKARTVFMRILLGISDGLLSSVFAIGATYAITASRFSHFSSLAPISTAIFSPIIEIYMYLGLFALTLGWLIPLNNPIKHLTSFINLGADTLASFKWASSSYSFIPVKLSILLFTICFFSFLILKIKHKRIFLSITVMLFLSVSLIAAACTRINIKNDDLIYYSSFEGDTIVLKDGGEVSLIYSGDLNDYNGRNSASLLYSLNLTYCDSLILNNYSENIDIYVDTFTESTLCTKIYLPLPKNDKELAYSERIANILSKRQSYMQFYSTEEPIALGESFYFHIYHTQDEVSRAQNIFNLLIDGEHYTYISSGIENNTSLTTHPIFMSVENLIIGNHGKVYGESRKFEAKLPKIKRLYFGSYITLDKDTLDYYAKKGASVHNTDAGHSLIH